MKIDLKESYPYYFRLAVIASLVLHFLFFVAAPAFTPSPYVPRRSDVVEIEEYKPEELSSVEEPEQVERPKLPVEAESEAEVEEETVEDMVGLDAVEKLPPPPDLSRYVYIPHEVAPQPKPGFFVQPKYPEIAKQAGIEGRVILHLFINTEGNVLKVLVAKSLEESLDKSAMEAAYKWKFYPALQRDKPVAVWASRVVTFILKER